ncbi:MAG: RHS repeat-associated core domain-containing protein, partial [Sphingomicrobium sp.]
FMSELSLTGQPHAFYYYKARIYRADIGRFLQTDPVGYDGGINLYAYVGGDPVNKTDPTGLEAGSVTPSYEQNYEIAKQYDPETARAGLIAVGVVYTGGAACAVGGCELAAGFAAKNPVTRLILARTGISHKAAVAVWNNAWQRAGFRSASEAGMPTQKQQQRKRQRVQLI